jgi:hypothetical protein
LEIETASTVGRSAKEILEAGLAHKMLKRFETVRRRIANIFLRVKDNALRRAYVRLGE